MHLPDEHYRTSKCSEAHVFGKVPATARGRASAGKRQQQHVEVPAGAWKCRRAEAPARRSAVRAEVSDVDIQVNLI